MRVAVTAVAFAASVASFSAQTAGAPNESFARDMMTCAFKHRTFAFGPGDASVAESAAVEAQAYLTAAVEASNESFVEKESGILNPQAQAAVLAAMEGAKNVAGIVAIWTDTKAKCDQQLASFASATDR